MELTPDYSYLGSGLLRIREFGSAAPYLPIGNCSSLDLAPQVSTLQLPNHMTPGGGTRNRVDRITDVGFNFTFHDFSGENFARFLRGTSTQQAAGSVPAEPVVGYLGGWTPLAKYASTITTVEPVGGGTAYTAGTDYQLLDGGIFVPSTSTIPAPVAGAANFEVNYATAAQTVTETFVNAAKNYSMIFTGLNEARSGKGVVVVAHKVSGGVIDTLGLLGEDYGGGTVPGSLLADPAQGTGLSQYARIITVD